MGERLGPLEDLSRKVNRVRAFVFGEDDPSNDVEMLLSEGHIEKLVREGRAPLRIGSMGTLGEDNKVDMKPYYQVPPRGFHPEDIDHIFSSMGQYVFVNKLGVVRKGSTYQLTEEQAEEVDRRVEAELQKLDQSK